MWKKKGVELDIIRSNQVCDNLRIDGNTSPHLFCALMSLATLSFLGSQFGSIRAVAKVQNNSQIIILNAQLFFTLPGNMPYSSLKHFVKYDGAVNPT